MNSETHIRMEDIQKVYPDGVKALRGVTVDFRRGEVHGLLGENGAGKSTLMRILFGQIRQSGGRILIDGSQVGFNSPKDAIAKRIGMVFQHFMLVPSFTGLENIVLGLDVKGQSDFQNGVRGRALDFAERLGLKVDLDRVIENMPMGERQRIEILKLLVRNVNLLILDEPTSALTPFEADELLKIMKKLRGDGKTIVFVTHKLKEALSICDRITVVRRGLRIDTVYAKDVDLRALAKMMVGKEMLPEVRKEVTIPGKVLLEVRALSVRSDTGNEAVRNVTFEVRAGEVFGIAGVAGNGQKELVEAITGLREVEKGEVFVNGVKTTNRPPKDVYDLGLAHVAEDRFGRAVVPTLSVKDNLILGLQFKDQFSDGLLMKPSAVEENARTQIRDYSIMATEDTPVKSLSGGNVQRVVIAREFSKSPLLIVASQPTTGLDISATEFVRNELIKMRGKGKAVLLVSSELDEVLALSDRVAVMYEGEFMGVSRPEELDNEKLGLLMGGVKVE